VNPERVIEECRQYSRDWKLPLLRPTDAIDPPDNLTRFTRDVPSDDDVVRAALLLLREQLRIRAVMVHYAEKAKAEKGKARSKGAPR
jgi:hypothetical protein